jgi:hypothetical protein
MAQNIRRAQALEANTAHVFSWDSLRSHNGCISSHPHRPTMSMTRTEKSRPAKSAPGKPQRSLPSLQFSGPTIKLQRSRHLVEELRTEEAQVRLDARAYGVFRPTTNTNNVNPFGMQPMPEDQALALALALSLSESESHNPEHAAATTEEVGDEDDGDETWEVVDFPVEAGAAVQPNVIQHDEDSFVNLVVRKSYAAVIGRTNDDDLESFNKWRTNASQARKETTQRFVPRHVTRTKRIPKYSLQYDSVNALALEVSDALCKAATRTKNKHRK